MANGIYDLISRGIQDAKNYASIPATYAAGLYGNYINKNVGENMARSFRTDEMNERLSQQVSDQLSPGVNSGSLTYTDFGLPAGVSRYLGDGKFEPTRNFTAPTFKETMNVNSADLANAYTIGNLNFNRNPSGDINYTGNRYDFPQPTFMNNNPMDIPLDELNVNAPQFSFTDYLQGNYDLNQNIPSSKPADAISRTNVQGMDLEMDPGAFMNPNIQPSQNMFQRAGNAIQGGLGSIRDFAVDKGMSAKNLLGSGATYAMGLPGIVGSGAMSLLGGLGNMFERRDGMATVDEFGNLISGEDLDKQNALGGYYTDAARASRRRGKSIQTMLARQTKEGLSRLGQKRLDKLLADQKKQDDARQAAFNSIMSQGNNQQSFYDSLNQGSGSTAVSGNPNTSGAGDAPGYSGPTTFADGGLASMFRQKR